ncbi:hypothetical protein COO91_06482 [Nostoc flagelliforme CCNUN1]|uniref:Uncharacterized protein n=1 Tax=Nostoc flagelliforme CCNUN1 TaxID=2038116 RepID=A0A2K8SYE1_9NOSO|nr:hypothetical protein COO91_06482 [Nostoc flagelliforme CCNUN1]
MQISSLKTLITPNLNDILPILDIDGGLSGKPILRKVAISSILGLSQPRDISSINNSLVGITERLAALEGLPAPKNISWHSTIINGSIPTVIANNSYDLSIPVASVFNLIKVSSNVSGRLRIYLSSSQREADINRLLTVDPIGNHGLLIEVVFSSSLLIIDLSPTVFGVVVDNIFAIFTPTVSSNNPTTIALNYYSLS